ncbi:MAG: hypothetical protein LBF58_09355 [Deltaproteobacteria bacterium]|jgi:hypothetical protein|nr:hypothetical protein [Deltaproteobacteria bacterium]
MSKQVMDINCLAEFIANTFGTSKVLVQNNSNVLTIEPLLADNSDSTNLENYVDETKAGTLSLDDFTELKLFTKGFKFNKDEANVRR